MKRSSDRKNRHSKRSHGVSSIQIMEEAFQLLRTTPGSSLWLYYFGTIPFVCALFYFWADLSRTNFAEADIGFAALAVSIAFFWKCSWQSRFCRSLWELINPGRTPRQSGWQGFRYHAALWMFHAFAIPLIVLGIGFVIPLGWVLSTFQNGYVLGLTQDYGKSTLRKLSGHAIRNSHYEWAQNLGIWIAMGFIGFLTWINIMAACGFIPQLARMFFGIESIFTKNSGTLGNSTFIFGTLLITYLILSPMLKAIFVLRCFYADARTTGADLLSRLADLQKGPEQSSSSPVRSKSSASGRKAAVLLVVSFLLAGSDLPAQENSPGPVPVEAGDSFQKAIEETMSAKKYQWKLSRYVPREEVDSEKSWLHRKLTQIANSVEAKVRRMFLWVGDIIDQIFEKLKNKKFKAKPVPGVGEGLVATAGTIVSGLLIVLVVALIAWVLFLVVKHYVGRIEEAEGEELGLLGDIDLESEDIVADQLPEDEWMKLARSQIAKGETRLAIRALFLATLAHLGERGLLKIQRYKSNRDYRKELELRARQKTLLRDAFSENTGLFERAWYGLHQIGDDSLDHFMKNYEAITGDLS